MSAWKWVDLSMWFLGLEVAGGRGLDGLRRRERALLPVDAAINHPLQESAVIVAEDRGNGVDESAFRSLRE
jgi:hypothetical protein